MSLDFTRQMSAREEGSAIDKIRELVAAHLEVDVSRVTDDAHLIEDLGADWLAVLRVFVIWRSSVHASGYAATAAVFAPQVSQITRLRPGPS